MSLMGNHRTHREKEGGGRPSVIRWPEADGAGKGIGLTSQALPRGPMGVSTNLVEREVEVDGETDVEWELDLRR
jgi:hypothetical protein